MLKIDKKPILNTLIILTIPIVLYFMLSVSIYESLAVVIGLGLIQITSKNIKSETSKITILLTASLFMGLFFSQQLGFFTGLILGVSIGAFYTYMEIRANPGRIWLITILLLSWTVFNSSIDKFRGANKLLDSQVDMAIPLIVLLNLGLFFLLLAFKKKIGDIKTPNFVFSTMILIFSGIYFAISYQLFKEIGTETFAIPLIAGLIAGSINLFIKQKLTIAEINKVVLLTIIPYQISGLMGILIALLSAMLFSTLITDALGLKNKLEISTIYNLIPLAFLLSAAELRENEGLITRFSLTTGYQIGWIILSLYIVHSFTSIVDKLRKAFIENEMDLYNPILITIFTITSAAFIIRFGHDESMASLILVSSLYLFFINFAKGKKDTEVINTVSSLAGVVGSISFLLLTRI